MLNRLIGKKLPVFKPITVVLKDAGKGNLARLPPGEVLAITGVANVETGLLMADWNGSAVLVFKQDLENRR